MRALQLSRIFLALVVFYTGLTTALPSFGALTHPAIDPVDRFHTALIDVMRTSDSRNAAARRDAIDPVMRRTFDFRRMAQLIVGPSVWRGASPQEKDRLVDAFATMSASTYAAQFRGWSGESFETLAVESGPRDAHLVRARLNIPDGEPVSLTYVMTPSTDGAWRITDVLISGTISELAVRRADYAQPLRAHGLGYVIDRLQDQARRLVESAP